MSGNLSDLELKSFGLSPDQIDEVRMAVVEACAEVLESPGGADREVQILLEALGTGVEPEGLQITIRDTGVGLPGKLAAIIMRKMR